MSNRPQPNFKNLGIHHIGLAVRSIEEAEKTYCDILGFTKYHEETLANHGVKVSFLKGSDGSAIELLEPTRDDTSLAKFLVKQGEGLHHLCFEVDNVNESFQDLISRGLRPIDQKPRLGAEAAMIAFFYPQETNGVLIEILEQKTLSTE